eukprot:11734768-Alexandrium_andersonii.AAC.1
MRRPCRTPGGVGPWRGGATQGAPGGLATGEGSPVPHFQPMPTGRPGTRSEGAPRCLRPAQREGSSLGVGSRAAVPQPEGQPCEPQATDGQQQGE